MGAKGWIEPDESAKEMLARVSADRPFLLLPPLHRVPLRPGNVVEIVGPSPSAKTHVLMQAAVNCILPKEWNGVHYGGLGHLAMFLDLDCRFDISRLSQILKHRIMESNGPCTEVDWEQKDVVDAWNCDTRRKPNVTFDEELYVACLRRFLYIRCYDSFEFLATLKTLHYRLQKEREAHGISVHFLMIDSIGAFHWVDRALTSFPTVGNNRKSFSLQSLSETVVQEIRNLLLVHPMLVIATKATIYGERYSGNEVKRKRSSPDNSFLRTVTSDTQQRACREYMPSVWQLFVTHRILLRAPDDHLATSRHQNHSVYLSEWLLPSLNCLDTFIVRDVTKSPMLHIIWELIFNTIKFWYLLLDISDSVICDLQAGVFIS